MNVIENWRNRGLALRGAYLQCEACGAFAPVRRALCTNCGSDMATATQVRIPRKLRAVAYSHSHLVVERMDQKTRLRPAVLLELPNDRLMSFPLSESDRDLGARLVGQELELVLRRTTVDDGTQDALAYGRKATATAATRAGLKKVEEGRK